MTGVIIDHGVYHPQVLARRVIEPSPEHWTDEARRRLIDDARGRLRRQGTIEIP
jgi:hypothetical protein